MKHWIYSFLNNFSSLLFAVTSVQVDAYATFNTKTDATIAFDGCAGKVHLYSADDATLVELNEATNVNSMIIPSGQVVTRVGMVKTVYVKGTTKGGTLHVSGDLMSESKGDFEMQDTLNVRKQ